jgi:sugar phosphate isomerase/epimerase
MSLEDVFDFCAKLGFDAVDPTGYYFPGYPAAPSDAYLYRIKRRALLLGLDFSGTGVRNDFVSGDKERVRSDIALVKTWVEVAARLGAPVLRVFAGRERPAGANRDEANAHLVEALRECAGHGAKFGVMLALQNHNEFIKTAGQLLQVLAAVDSPWLGVHLDIGSFRQGDPYTEIASAAPHAVNWQIKEEVYPGGKPEKTDYGKIVRIAKESGYRGYLPLETLGAGDPRQKIPRMLAEFRDALRLES